LPHAAFGPRKGTSSGVSDLVRIRNLYLFITGLVI
jgi:hypothetical protein